MEVCIKFSFFSNNYSVRLDSLADMCMSWQLCHKLKSRKWHWRLVPLPGLTSWHLAPSYHEVTVTESESLSTKQLFLERKFCENSIFTGEVVGDALGNKKIVLKEQRKEKTVWWPLRSIWRKITTLSPTAQMLLYVNFFMYVHRFCLETYLLLDGLPSRDDESHLPACSRSYWITCYQ